MFSDLSDVVIVRMVVAGVFFLLILFIIFSGKRTSKPSAKDAAIRVEPHHNSPEVADDSQFDAINNEDFRTQATLGFEEKKSNNQHNYIGVRQSEQYEKIIMLYMAAKSGQSISGAELVLATEKVGLVYGHHNVYHRLSDSTHSNEPVFSMANVVQPGCFDLSQIDSLQTPGVSFFMTLPGPVSAIQAWDTMLPIAERMAQLLDTVLLDAERNALGRQRILHIKEELRAFDREKERQTIKPGR
jgi:cell division protein ZipA